MGEKDTGEGILMMHSQDVVMDAVMDIMTDGDGDDRYDDFEYYND